MKNRSVIDVARSASVMVRVHGPDPKGRKMRRHAFYHSESGDTTLSASGLLLPDHIHGFRNMNTPNMNTALVVVTCASLIEPFLSPHDGSTKKGIPTLTYGAKIDVLTELSDDFDANLLHQQSSWLPANLITLVDVKASATALQSLFEAHGGASEQGSWEIGWALAPSDSNTKMRGEITQSQADKNQIIKETKEIEDFTSSRFLRFKSSTQPLPSDLSAATTRIAILHVPYSKHLKNLPEITFSEPRKRGDFILVSGSPFGALSPLHFYNSITVGIVSNSWPPGSSQPSLLMADIRCLPGMEGSPVFNDQASLVGILIRPLRQRGGGAEVQLVITWEALFSALAESQLVHPQEQRNSTSVSPDPSFPETASDHSSAIISAASSTIDRAMASIVLVTVGDGAWASGIVLNDKGLILTNAHLLEPWRFGKTPSFNKQTQSVKSLDDVLHDDRESQVKLVIRDGLFTNDNIVTNPVWDITYKSYRRIRVRLDHILPRRWCNAKVVYVSKGPLDIALLQLESIPSQLCPIVPELKSPCPGSRALVIGHGLFGPRSDLCPSVSAGVVSRVVHTAKPEGLGSEYPAMLETTAAVHPGGSGGVVVNEEGRMIGLVTSNARHSGGTVIPHLNFSIPCAALMPIFLFASGGGIEDLSILKSIDKPNEPLSKVWALVPPTPQRQPPSMPYLPDVLKDDKIGSDGEQRKGFRFAKFIAEKGAELARKDKEHNKKENITQKGMPIKTSTTVDFVHSRL